MLASESFRSCQFDCIAGISERQSIQRGVLGVSGVFYTETSSIEERIHQHSGHYRNASRTKVCSTYAWSCSLTRPVDQALSVSDCYGLWHAVTTPRLLPCHVVTCSTQDVPLLGVLIARVFPCHLPLYLASHNSRAQAIISKGRIKGFEDASKPSIVLRTPFSKRVLRRSHWQAVQATFQADFQAIISPSYKARLSSERIHDNAFELIIVFT